MENVYGESIELYSKIKESIGQILKVQKGEKYDEMETSYVTQELSGKFNGEYKYKEKRYRAMSALNEYLIFRLEKDGAEKIFINEIYIKADEIKEFVYYDTYENFLFAKRYIIEGLKDFLSLNRKELLEKEKALTKVVSQTLSLLFGANKGSIVGEFNVGMYGMNQQQLHEHLKNNHVVYKNDRFADIMDDDLLRYKLLGLSLLENNASYVYYNELPESFRKKEKKIQLQGFYKRTADEYLYYKKYAKVIGLAIKELYNRENNIDPIECLINNGTEEQLTFFDDHDPKHKK